MKGQYVVLKPRIKRSTFSFAKKALVSLKTTFDIDLLSGLKKALGAFFAKNVTVQYPLESIPLSPRYRAIHKLQRLLESDNERCIGCGLCEKICTSNCIRIITDKGADGRKKILDYSINFGRCIYCGLCAEVCPELAIVHGDRFENASVNRAHFGFKQDMLIEKASLVEFAGFGSVTPYANENIKQTPLSYVLKFSTQSIESSADSSQNTSQNVESSADSAPISTQEAQNA